MNPDSKEIASLAGKIDKKGMGLKIAKEKPKKPKTKSKKKTETAMTFKGGNILDEKFDSTLLYRPKTKENQQKYEQFLGRMYQIVEDHSQDTLISMADEVLAIIRGEGTDEDKKVNAEAIFG